MDIIQSKKIGSYSHALQGIVLVWIILFGSSILFVLNHKINSESQIDIPFMQSNRLDNSSDQIRHPRLPQALVIGSRKSGTRALLKFLEINPAIRAAPTEIHFFDKPNNYNKGLEWYRRQMPSSTENEITIEKSPAYFVTEGVAEKVHSMNPNMKLLLIVRDPVTRLISDYSQIAANQAEPDMNEYGEDSGRIDYLSSSDQDKWLELERNFEKFVMRSDGQINDKRQAIRAGMYAIHLENWRAYFRMDQIHIVDGEALIVDPVKELVKVETFLGIQPRIKRQDLSFNPRKGFYCISKPEDQGGDYPQNGLADNKLSSNPNPMQGCLSKTKGRRHIRVRTGLEDNLKLFYAPYNEYFASLVGNNFTWI